MNPLRMTADRAAVVARAIIELVAQHIRDDGIALCQQITDYLRDEFNEVAQQTRNEIRNND